MSTEMRPVSKKEGTEGTGRHVLLPCLTKQTQGHFPETVTGESLDVTRGIRFLRESGVAPEAHTTLFATGVTVVRAGQAAPERTGPQRRLTEA